MKLEQDKQYVPTDDTLKDILSQYGLNYISSKLATSGIENTTIIIDTQTGKYVLRVYRQDKKSTEEILTELEFTQYLQIHGIKVADVLKNLDNRLVTSYRHDGVNWQMILMRFVDGVHAAKYSGKLIDDIATTQARMHQLSADYKSTNTNEITHLVESYFIRQIDVAKISDIDLRQFVRRAEEYRLDLDKSLPKGLCHLDYDNDNILSDGDRLAVVLDFDDLAIAPFVVCLGYTMWHVLYTDSVEVMKLYLKIYEQTRGLSPLEKDYLYRVILFRHYVISSLKILNGHTDDIDIAKYLSLENTINLLHNTSSH